MLSPPNESHETFLCQFANVPPGLGNAEIAEQLHISEKTVRNHASNVFDKLGVWSRAQAIVFARDHGFIG